MPNPPVPPGKATGLIPRDYRTHPPGYLACAPVAPDDWLVPESEQADRLAEQQASKTSLWDLREAHYDVLKSLDQNGYGLCHTADTEVLTERGWTPWPEYNWSDLLGTVNPMTGLMEFQSPFERHVHPYAGEMIHSTNRRLDFGVTPDHRMMVRKWDENKRTLSGQYSFQRAGDIGWYAGLMPAPRGFIGTELKRVAIAGDREYDGDDFAALVALVTSDGFAGGTEKTQNLVSFAAFRQDRRQVTAALAARLGFREAPSRPGVWNRWNAGALAAWFRANGYSGSQLGAEQKRVPDVIKAMTARQIVHFLDFFGDRSYRPESCQFYSTSKRLTDDLQELHLRIGKRGTIGRSDPRSHQILNNQSVSHCKSLYTLTVGQVDTLCIARKKHIETDHYKGLVYCAAVPNGTLITRRNGSILISGNCWFFSTTKAAMYTRAIMGEPPVRLSAWWGAGQINNWQDRGGWGAASLEFFTKRGTPAIDYCPKYSRGAVQPGAEENAALHKVTEWYDGTEDRDRNRAIMISAFLLGLAPVLDYNHLSHSMAGCRLVSINPLVVDCDNSWNEIDQYGAKGTYRLTGSKAIPDGIVVPRVSIPSVV